MLSEITANIKEELVKINNAYTVFSSIAGGAFHYSDILAKSRINTTSSLYDTLEVLRKMDLISYVCPINDKNNNEINNHIYKHIFINYMFIFTFRFFSHIYFIWIIISKR